MSEITLCLQSFSPASVFNSMWRAHVVVQTARMGNQQRWRRQRRCWLHVGWVQLYTARRAPYAVHCYVVQGDSWWCSSVYSTSAHLTA